MKKNRDNCLTKPMYGGCVCLSEGKGCEYSVTFGFSYRCTHPDKTDFYGHVKGLFTLEELRDISRELRKKRRREFVAGLDEFGKLFLKLEGPE